MLKRFLFNNGISLVTLLSVVFYAGEYKERFANVEKIAIITAAKAADIQDLVNITKFKISAMEIDLTYLREKIHERYSANR